MLMPLCRQSVTPPLAPGDHGLGFLPIPESQISVFLEYAAC